MRKYLVTEKLCVGYGGEALIKDIDIRIDQGEIVALVGPNGAGKSTILKSIARQLKAISGRVEVLGAPLDGLSDRALAARMAVLLTERTRPELTTCRDIVAMGRYPYTGRLGLLSPADGEKVDAAMAAVQVANLAERDFGAVSDGQRQRVLLARALCQEPEILILDEPTAFLDIRHKLKLLGLLRRMARERGIAVVMSLHEIDLAQKVSDRVLCVKGDALALAGRPEEVFTEERVRELYGIEAGGYDPLFGSVELPRIDGAPRAFVLSGAGSGIPVYRALQRRGVPFAAGILYENDVDFRLARLLAVETVSEKPFHPVSDAAFERAIELVRACDRIVDAGVPIGPANARMAELISAASGMRGYEKWEK